MFDTWIHPSLIFLLGSFLTPLFKGRAKQGYLLLLPVLAFLDVYFMPHGVYGKVEILNWTMTFGVADRLSHVFAYIFTLMAIIGFLFGLHVKSDGEHIAALWYVGGSLGVTFAGDFLTLFVFWEMMAFSSVFLIWFRRTPSSSAAGFRYILVHTFGGLLLLAGILILYQETGDLTIRHLQPNGLAPYLIMCGFILNAAVPPLGAWLPDAYPMATVTGAVFMCCYTTKTAVYALARVCAGYEILTILGVIMAMYGVMYAVLQNDTRKLLAYHIISQVGYMVAGCGLGTEIAINGVCAHAFAHILYKALLFMGTGSVLYATGTAKISRLGGLWRTMPNTLIFTLIGGMSISAFPLFSGFVSKSMVIAAYGEKHIVWGVIFLTMASAGTYLSTTLKIPYFVWFGKDQKIKAQDPPLNMQAAMFVASFFCIFIGCYPEYLYNMLPYPVHFHPYTTYHIWETVQILLFTQVGFFLLIKILKGKEAISLDTDWFYRKGARIFMAMANRVVAPVDSGWAEVYRLVGLRWIMIKVGRATDWFDRVIIDTILDKGIAGGICSLSDILRRVQTGNIQQYIGTAIVAVFCVLFAYVLF